MPEISNFYGIRITINYDDHNPPHFHAEYNGNNALINMRNATVLKGSLPKKQLNQVLAWTGIHQTELLDNWELAEAQEKLNRIDPLR